MITVPTLPTDNLYKFVALTGVFLLLVAVLYPTIKIQELNSEIIVLNGEIERHRYESEILSEKRSDLKKKLKELVKPVVVK